MIDTDSIKSSINCRQYISSLLGKPKTSSKNYDAYQCPLHHEQNGCSFVVYDDHWQCFGKCQTSGDVIKFVQLYHAVTFTEACQMLTGQTSRPTPSPRNPDDIPPDKKWQDYAHRVVDVACNNLWAPGGSRALQWLMHVRGIPAGYIMSYRLGYIPADNDNERRYGKRLIHDWTKPDGKPVFVPCGITIPHFADNHLWAVRVRRPVGDPKYMGIVGGSKSLYGYDDLEGRPLVIVEGEFDKIILQYAAGDLVDSVALASASNKRIAPRWKPKLVAAPMIYARMDNDAAGLAAADELRRISATVRPIQVPVGKDVNDYFNAGGMTAVRAWIIGLLEDTGYKS